jgi:hypothetical protein
MRTTECFQAVVFRCPECNEKNTMRAGPDSLDSVGACTHCRWKGRFSQLIAIKFREFGQNISLDTFCEHAFEFICEVCDETNLIMPDQLRIATKVKTRPDPAESWKPPAERVPEVVGITRETWVFYNGKKTPETGKCKCGLKYRLLVVEPEK